MIDLDAVLRPWVGLAPRRQSLPGWSEERAVAIAHAVAPRVDVIAEHEPGDQEWVRFVGQDSYRGLLSVYFPLAIVTSELVAPLRVEAPDLTIVQITDYDAEEMRASPDILASTLLFRQPAADFDPEAITADDLFFESL